MSLLAEHEITRTLDLCTEIARRLDIQIAQDPALEELRHEVAPETVLSEIEQAETGQGDEKKSWRSPARTS